MFTLPRPVSRRLRPRVALPVLHDLVQHFLSLPFVFFFFSISFDFLSLSIDRELIPGRLYFFSSYVLIFSDFLCHVQGWFQGRDDLLVMSCSVTTIEVPVVLLILFFGWIPGF